MAVGAPTELERALAQELDRRIAELAALNDHAFGRMGAWDAALVVAGFLLVPLLCVWLAA